MKKLTRKDVEGMRGELFYMVLFSLAWVLIGEQVNSFRDYAIGSGVVLIMVVWLSLYSIQLFHLEESMTDEPAAVTDKRESRRNWLYAFIFIFEAAAILATWVLLINKGYSNWLVISCALVAGLHFFPLAWVTRQINYVFLGIWICLIALFGFWLRHTGKMHEHDAGMMVAFGCAAGALVDGVGIMWRTRRRARG